MNVRAMATQAGYMHQLVAAVSLSPIHSGYLNKTAEAGHISRQVVEAIKLSQKPENTSDVPPEKDAQDTTWYSTYCIRM